LTSFVEDFSCGEHHIIIKKNKYYGRGYNRDNQLGLGRYAAVKYSRLKLLKIN
jgi:hypothetical protein